MEITSFLLPAGALVVLITLSAVLILLLLSARKKSLQFESEKNNYETICKQANDAVLVIDIVDGRIHQANPCLADMLGYPLEKLKNLTVFDIHPKEMLERCSNAIADAWEQKGLIYQDIPFVTASGELLPVECSAKVAPFAGRPALIIYARDIRERLRLEKEIRDKNAIIAQKNRDMLDSIEYAKRIQLSLLPSEEEFNRFLPDSFIFFRPRDIVSGDFYWVAQPLPKGGALKVLPFGEDLGGAALLCTADCTGHGVPGAFMSMLCTALLNEAVNNKGITQPDKIFEDVRLGIIGALKQKGQSGGTKDGMDATLIAIEYGNAETQFVETRCVVSLQIACANNPVYIISNGILTEIKPDRFPVGVFEGELQPFTLHSVNLNKGDMIYAVTDGFEDQFGGSPPSYSPAEVKVGIGAGKKFKSRRLKELLLSISNIPVEEQKKILEKTFDDWKGKGEQTDDVTIIGIRI